MSERLVSVLTTIQEPTRCVRELVGRLDDVGAKLFVAGDKKGPAKFEAAGTRFLPLSEQLGLPYKLARLLPTGHYVRKNLAYLVALGERPQCVYETDDDNMPNEVWAPRSIRCKAQKIEAKAGRRWFNVYRLFSSELIWPRGLPLDRITDPASYEHDASAPAAEVESAIQQGLADLAPDVDAAWRLILDRPFCFDKGRPSVWLPPGTWCPFNSQTTWWWPVAYPLMYLPSFCTFRMTDIWRSFVAQRCLWELGQGVVFHAPEAIQERNVHNLMRDFADEVPGYLKNDGITKMLEEVKLKAGAGAVAENLVRCYERLVEGGIFGAEELPLVKAWVEDVGKVVG